MQIHNAKLTAMNTIDFLDKLDLQAEQRLILQDIGWQEYLAIDSVLEEVPGLRLTYLEGLLEIMTLSSTHEREKKAIARLLEMYAFVKNIDLHGCGSTTYRSEAQKRGLEPDECYCVGNLKDIPDFAVEVILTSGGIDKLEVYKGLGVAEVWFWQDRKFSVYFLNSGEYQAIAHSTFFPALDLELLANYVQPDNQPAAIREFCDRLQTS
jgi:Uma2 family endonuclease